MKNRKIRFDRLFIVILIFLIFVLLLAYFIYVLWPKEEKKEFDINDLSIGELDYSEVKKLDLDLDAKGYILVRLNDLKVLYGDNYDNTFYPASLAKVLTMDTILHHCDDVNSTSSFTDSQYYELISENASLAYLTTNKDYSIEELLYALILPSGADAAKALENYSKKNNFDLVEEMNNLGKELDFKNSNFTNTTGLHDNNLYTTLSDYTKLIVDVLKNDTGKDVLKSLNYKTYNSTLSSLKNVENVKVYGGKTGYTDEAQMNICVLYEVNNRSYLLILRNIGGSPYSGNPLHIKETKEIFEYLY